MSIEVLSQWEGVIYPLGVILYIGALRFLDQYQRKQRRFTDEEYLSVMAKMAGCSEYRLFVHFSKTWNHPRARVDDDFKAYLIDGELPHYVRDQIRKHKKQVDANYQPFYSGGGLPPSWMA